MPKNLAGKTYEVYTADGKRWLIESEHPTRSAALEHAEDLLTAGNHDGVRVLSESERTGEEEIIFEERIDRDDAVVKVIAIEDAPPCEDLADFYRLPARRTAGRLLRPFLDDQGVSALELAFSPGRLMMFERNGKLFAPAIQRVGTIQARIAGDKKPAKRIDELFRIFEQIKERAKAASDEDKYPALLKAKGLNTLIESVGQWEPEENREFSIRAAIVGALSDHGDWNGKIQLLVNLVREDPSPEAVGYVDETVAEILDGAEAVKEILGGQADAAGANRMLIHLSGGRCSPPKNPISCIVELNETIDRLDMPLTGTVLLERVQQGIGGVRPLTREDRKVERDAFVGLVRELAGSDGLLGGPGMCDAVVRRSRIALKEGETDQTVEQAINHLLDLMPNRAVRLGFLLDLAVSPLGESEHAIIMQFLERIAQQLSFLASLVSDTGDKETVNTVVKGLKRRLDNEALPKEWRQTMSASLDDLVARSKGGGGKAGPKKAKTDFTIKNGKDMSDPTGDQKEIPAGELIFEEGEMGDLAYLIIAGQVEIFRSSGNRERVLATLGRGEIIGEMSLIDSQPRMASARALEDTKVSMISRNSLQQRLDRLEGQDRVLRRLIAVLVNRIRGQAPSPE